ncbi:MAG: DNA-binding transcriptional regulator [Anaerocolumna sp.]|jgi:predicted DNA-binding transcriptional regulator YafY|nr:DNA-binding transcriptional regulator [Anaerocolumna sp.]
MKLDRLLGILTVLLQKEKVTAPYLARKFEVSRRTINRDIEDICKAGIPLVTMQGANGGITIAEGYKIDKNLFTYEELENIIIGLNGIKSVTKSVNVEQLIDKFSVKNESVNSIKDNIIIDLASFYKGSLSEKISLLKDAIRTKYKVTFRYFGANGDSIRQIEPYYITFKWSSWYVLGYCLVRNDFRLFKLNRMAELNIINETYVPREIPVEKEDLDNYFLDNINVTVLFDESVKYRLVDAYGVDSFITQKDGRLLFQSNFTNKQFLIDWLFSFADKVEVVEPQELKEEITKIAKNIIYLYEKT